MTLQEIRQSAPVRSGDLAVDYKNIAACVAHEIAPRYTVTNAVLEREGRAVLTYINRIRLGFVSEDEPVWELTIARVAGTAGSRAEFRSMRTVTGTTPWADVVWPAVEKCGRA